MRSPVERSDVVAVTITATTHAASVRGKTTNGASVTISGRNAVSNSRSCFPRDIRSGL
jgi:hypothetical protein